MKKRWQQWRTFISTVAIAYSLVCVTLYYQQQRLIFFPSRQLKHTPALYQLPYDDVWIPIVNHTGRSEFLHGWWIPAQQPEAPVILYFHHNAVNMGANVSQALQFQQLGYTVLLFDYRGFGQSQGAFPTESQVYEDAEAAWDYLTEEKLIPPSQIIIYGHSIGGAIAINLATKHPDSAALIVQNSFTSMREMTQRFGVYWLLPVELLLQQRFDSLDKMQFVEMPVLIITGTDDLQIPVEMGERLYTAASGFKQFILVLDGGHDNHLSKRYRQQVKQFVEQAIKNNGSHSITTNSVVINSSESTLK
ncbi:alpha/beta hydrolase [Oscillatoria sp. FACHB-1407]|uniref:alpha/beta hydrolase n=1 Tax=Oscillatoria sp. FACHB-1407 TaxID=2692847 RepID=UPI0016822F51|nr:alpha/beta hydrolase [Oscillatoria sp. FACHB-1407]MBD2460331.1 alpha/beta hydrolase [Oscillatoria sp. FACHB-1407]